MIDALSEKNDNDRFLFLEGSHQVRCGDRGAGGGARSHPHDAPRRVDRVHVSINTAQKRNWARAGQDAMHAVVCERAFHRVEGEMPELAPTR